MTPQHEQSNGSPNVPPVKTPFDLRVEMLNAGAYLDHVDFFLERFDQYPFLAQAPTAIKPPLVTNLEPHMSVRLKFGWRLWGFETEAKRDQFYWQFGGQPFP